jgi:3-oxoacyl-[acyl-carrier-protein] synthase III
MFLCAAASYVPEGRLTNQFFESSAGLEESWILARTGMRTRSVAGNHENTNTMAISACDLLMDKLEDSFKESVDLIISASYTPYDTIFTPAHALQRHLGLKCVSVLHVGNACSSLISAIEVAHTYIAKGKARNVIVVGSEHNTFYSNTSDKVAGHLWGDAAVAFAFTATAQSESAGFEVIDVYTRGAACDGKADEGVLLQPGRSGLFMPNGRDVFLHACHYMASVTNEIVQKNGFLLEDIAYLIPHQANLRITKNVAEQLGTPLDRVISNVEEYGNTGCVGVGLGLSDNPEKFNSGDIIVMSVFGGGYGYGAALLRKL